MMSIFHVLRSIVTLTFFFYFTGCAAVKGGADLMFGQTNPYVDTEIEHLLSDSYFENETVQSAIKNVDTNNFSNYGNSDTRTLFWATGPSLPTPELYCLNKECVSTFSNRLLDNDAKEYILNVNHPYFSSLMNAVKICESNSPPIDPNNTNYDIPFVTSKCKLARSNISELYLSLSDKACNSRLTSIGAGQASTNFLLRFTNIASSAVATFAGVASTARWLSALSLASSETGALFDDEVFGRALNYAMAAKITDERAKTRTKIGTGLKSDILDYTLDQLMGDLRNYNQQCSYTHGQQLVTDSINGKEDSKSVQYDGYLTKLRSERKMVADRIETSTAEQSKFKSGAPEADESKFAAIGTDIDDDKQLLRQFDLEIRAAQRRMISLDRP